MELKDRLKELRANANLTQEDLANQIFVSRKSLLRTMYAQTYNDFKR